MRIVIWNIVFLLILSPATSSAEKRFDSQEASISLSTPDNWVKVSSELLDLTVNAMRQMSEVAKQVNYVDAYQLDQNQNQIDYPYILIQKEQTGRIPEEELLKSKSMKLNQDFIDDLESDFSELVLKNSTRLSNAVYDEKINAYWLFANMTIKGQGSVKGISNIHPTETGIVGVHCYFLEEDAKKFASVCRSILKSISIHENIKYRPKSGFRKILPFLFPKN